MKRLLLILLTLCLLPGCEGSSSGLQASSFSQAESRVVTSPGQLDGSTQRGSLTLLFGLVPEVRARIPDSAVFFSIQVFRAGGQLVAETEVARTPEVQLNNIPFGNLLVRVRFLSSTQQTVGYWEKFLTLDSGAVVLSFNTLLPGTPPQQLPSFPSNLAQPTTLALFEQPESVQTGSTFSLSFVVAGAAGQILDFNGSSFQLTASGGELQGQTTAAALNGEIIFENLTIDGDGPFRFFVEGQVAGRTLSGRSLTVSRTSTGPPPDLGVPARLVWITEPDSGQARRLLAPAPTLQVQDIYGNRVTDGRYLVTVTLESTGGGSLEGELNRLTSEGEVLFRSLSVNRAGEYRLLASADSLLTARTSPFSLTPEELLQNDLGIQFAAALTGGTDPYVSFNTAYCADLDRDGHLDISAANSGFNSSPGEQAFLFGFGDGTFQPVIPPQDFPAWSTQLLVDLNNDQLPEILGTSAVDGGSFVLVRNLGSRTFDTPQLFEVGQEPAALIAKSLYGDSTPEVVVVNRRSDSLTFFDIQTDPQFSASLHQTLSLPPNCRPTDIAGADFDDDGDIDLAVLTEQGEKILFLENQDGTFQSPSANDPRTIETGKLSSRMVAVDLNGDLLEELVVLHPADDEIEVFPAAGDFQFDSPENFHVPGQPETLRVVDVDGDGRPDLVSAGHRSDQLTVWQNFGEFSSWSRRTTSIAEGSLSLCSGDFTGDGAQDLIISLQGFDLMQLMVNRGDGEFAAVRRIERALPQDNPQLFAGRFDARPGLDLALAGSDHITVYSGGALQNGSTISSQTGAPIDFLAPVIDVNGDDIDDLVSLRSTGLTQELVVYLNQGDGRFVQLPPQTLPFGVSLFLPVGDLNGDLLDDLLIRPSDSGNPTLIFLSSGDGAFLEAGAVTVPRGVASADLDGDEILDLFYGVFPSQTRWLKGNGDGTFQPETVLPVNAAVSFAADFDGEEDPDLVRLLEGGRIQVFENLGGGAFGPGEESGREVVFGSVGNLRAVDLDSDGDLDLVATFQNSGFFTSISGFLILENLGNLQFSSARVYRGESRDSSPVFVDFEGDSDLDFVGIGPDGFRVTEQYSSGRD